MDRRIATITTAPIMVARMSAIGTACPTPAAFMAIAKFSAVYGFVTRISRADRPAEPILAVPAPASAQPAVRPEKPLPSEPTSRRPDAPTRAQGGPDKAA